MQKSTILNDFFLLFTVEASESKPNRNSYLWWLANWSLLMLLELKLHVTVQLEQAEARAHTHAHTHTHTHTHTQQPHKQPVIFSVRGVTKVQQWESEKDSVL